MRIEKHEDGVYTYKGVDISYAAIYNSIDEAIWFIENVRDNLPKNVWRDLIASDNIMFSALDEDRNDDISTLVWMMDVQGVQFLIDDEGIEIVD